MAEPMSLREARSLAFAAQGLSGAPDSTVLQTIDRLGLLQIDSVNVFERAHYMPLFSRLGAYDKRELDSLSGGFNPSLIEYWAHEASIIRTENLPLYKWRMDNWRAGELAKGNDSWMTQQSDLLKWIKAELAEKGPLTANAIEHDRNVRRGNWWGWSDVKRGLEALFGIGDLVSGGREKFSRIYALPEQVLPTEILNASISADEAKRRLILQAVTAIGIGTRADILDWHRLNKRDANHIIDELIEAGSIVEMKVESWREAALALPSTLEQRVDSKSRTTLLSPFDPLIWYRPRTERLFDFHYRIEIYTPEAKRKFGYYTLPVLHDNQIIGRIDLKNDRQNNYLIAKASWHEDGLPARKLNSSTGAVAKHLAAVAKWQGCTQVQIEPKGNWALELAAHFA
ncbi:MAG: hypothetical protein RL716_244 [Actinomycetota bacterium]|jgi:uncharacterized protein YcaQ